MDDLARTALSARARAYAPYSNYCVGAAVQTPGGVYSGSNVENASFGLTICAERAAILAAVAQGERRIERIAIATSSSPPASPCGACVQVLLEFADDCEVLLVNDKGEQRALSLAQIAPHPFRRHDLV